jgi:acetyl esterase/lipase
VADPLARYRYALEKNMSIHIDSHHAYWQDEAQMAEGSPQRIVEAGDMTHLPPLLLIQGTDDTVLSPGMTQRFAAAYRAAGGAVTLREFAGQAHTFITKFPEHAASQAALDAIAAFAVGGGQLDEPRAA